MSKLCSQYYSANDSWTAPAGVTKIFLIGHGGGGGGAGGVNLSGAVVTAGGAGTTPYLVQVDVVPNTTYSITIGAGGTGGIPRTSNTDQDNPGGNTTFGAVWTFKGSSTCSNATDLAGTPFAFDIGAIAYQDHDQSAANYHVTSGFAQTTITAALPSGTYNGGTNGAPGYTNTGGAGGAGSSTGTASNGTAATGFGAGGGAGGNGLTAGGSGGAGSPGQLWVVWIE